MEIREKDYAVDQTVGIKIQKEDRTKTGARLIPCKVFQIRTDTNMKKQTNYTVQLESSRTGLDPWI